MSGRVRTTSGSSESLVNQDYQCAPGKKHGYSLFGPPANRFERRAKAKELKKRQKPN